MPTTEIIDLSLSTDDENSQKTPAAARLPKYKSTAAAEASLDDIDFDFSPEVTRRAKRRRLSPEIELEDTAPQQPPRLAKTIPRYSVPGASNRKQSATAIDSDPILFTSSPRPQSKSTTKPITKPVLKKKENGRSSSPIGGYSDDDLVEQLAATAARPSAAEELGLTEVSANIGYMRTERSSKDGASSTSKAPKPRAALTSTERERRDHDKEQAKLDRAAAREAEKERKKLTKEDAAAQRKAERERKAREKQHAADLAEANKARHDKKVSTPEMIVDLPIAITGKSVETKVKEMLKNLSVETTTYTSSIPNIVKWRRKAKVRFDDELGYWVPRPEVIEEEPHMLCLAAAQEFVAMSDTSQPEDERLQAHVKRLKTKWPGAKITYLIEGLEAWLKKSKNARNREYQAAVRGTQTTSKSKAQPAVVDETAVEDALMRLQVVEDCFVYHTASSYETAEWIVHFTQHISTVPYRTVRNNISTTFCMDVGQVRTGEDAADTYIKMLQQIVRVTEPIAYGIASEYPDVESLVKGFERKGANMLEDLKKSSNRNGGFSDARIGPAISRRLEKVFLGRDPMSMDV